ncbi:MAG TPA: hypothetical protein VFL57_05430 [Bryobacteraceae bacterium]|nr:hypothetical protein [Bryobacteraceae bacterium]
MRRWSIPACTCVLFLLARAASSQEASLDLSDEADRKDEALLRETLYVSISADDIFRSPSFQELVEEQAKQMMEASQRRMRRQEARIAALRPLVEQGKASPDTLKDAFKEMQRRIDVGYLALSRSTVLNETVRAARAEVERSARRRGRTGTERYAGSRPFTPAVLRTIEIAFLRQFRRPLPISAEGDTALHRALGFDHTGRVDVAIHPDQPEGMWLRRFLETMRVPYYGFRTALSGSATAPHIHIGPGSIRYRRTIALGSRPRRSVQSD